MSRWSKQMTAAERRAYNAYMRAYRKRPGVRARLNARVAAWNHSRRGKKLKKQWHLSRYGITLEQHETQFADQGRRCGVCRTKNPGKRGWHTDHCHRTGKFRGILCMRCNLGIGYFNDDPAAMRNAASTWRTHDETCTCVCGVEV